MTEPHPDFMVADLKVWAHRRQFEDSTDEWDGNRLNITAVCSSPGSRIEARGAILHLREVAAFLEQLEALHETLQGEASLDCLEPNLQVTLATVGSTGAISARVEITPDHEFERHLFKKQIDQSHLPYIIAGLKALQKRFPFRGAAL